MSEKARLFGDELLAEMIVEARTPKEAKQLGRKVSGFEEGYWQDCRFDIAVRGNYAKFSQNKALRDFLLKTDSAATVEASPYDQIWGIGMDQNHPDAREPKRWQGLNLQGFVLMEVRTQLITE